MELSEPGRSGPQLIHSAFPTFIHGILCGLLSSLWSLLFAWNLHLNTCRLNVFRYQLACFLPKWALFWPFSIPNSSLVIVEYSMFSSMYSIFIQQIFFSTNYVSYTVPSMLADISRKKEKSLASWRFKSIISSN